MPPRAKRSRPAARPSSANGGSSTVPSPTAWSKPVSGSSPSRVCRQVSGAAWAPPMPLSDSTRSSSDGSRPRPCCHRPIPPPCCSGHCSLPDRSTCARSMAGKRSPPSQSISRLTSPHDKIPSRCWRSRRGNSYHIPDGTSYIVGGLSGDAEPNEGIGYELKTAGFGTFEQLMLIAEVRLLANAHSPVYHVVVGDVLGPAN